MQAEWLCIENIHAFKWHNYVTCVFICVQGRRKRGGRGGLSRPTFLGNLNYELVHSVKSAIEGKRVDSLWQLIYAADHDEC